MRWANGNTEDDSEPNVPDAPLNATDSQILSLLQLDGRMPYREIARQVNVSEGTVRSRVKRLQADGVLTIAAIADPFKLGYSIQMFCLLKVELSSRQSVIDELEGWHEITYISSCTGRADLYVQMVCRDANHLWEILYERLPTVPGVTNVETFHEIRMHKVSYVYPSFGEQPR